MSEIRKVALAGATGNLGPTVLKHLVDAGFEVTVLSRSSAHTFPSSVKVVQVDYKSLDSLTNALQGQDAVVSTVASAAIPVQILLIEAAIKAKVRRFIPSEFGTDTTNEKVAALPLFKNLLEVQGTLYQKAAANELTYTIICNGAFFDWSLKVGFLMNLREKSITLYDGGSRKFSTSTLATVGKAVVGVLKNLDETRNRAVFVQDAAITSRQLLEKGEKAAGVDGWKVEDVSLNQVAQAGWDALHQEKPDFYQFAMAFIKVAIYGDGYGGHFEKLDNELLGIEEMDEVEIQRLVNKFV